MRPHYVPRFLPYWGRALQHGRWPSPGQVIGRLVFAVVGLGVIGYVVLVRDRSVVLGTLDLAVAVFFLAQLVIYGPRAMKAVHRKGS